MFFMIIARMGSFRVRQNDRNCKRTMSSTYSVALKVFIAVSSRSVEQYSARQFRL